MRFDLDALLTVVVWVGWLIANIAAAVLLGVGAWLGWHLAARFFGGV